MINNKIALCSKKSGTLRPGLSAMGYDCIHTENDCGAIVRKVLMYSPAMLICEYPYVPSEEIARAMRLLEGCGIKPVTVIIGACPGTIGEEPYTYCFPALPDRERLRELSEIREKDFLPRTAISDELENTVTSIIRSIGIPANIKGYRYLRSAVILAVQDTTILDSVTKRLYPEIARRNGTTPSRVERAIRHAITSAWKRGEGDTDFAEQKLRCKIRFTDEHPTNSELIALISDSIRLDSSSFSRN